MLKTVSSKNSLIPWGRNENGSNIFISSIGGDEMWLKPYYYDLFMNVAAHLQENIVVFTEMWSKACDQIEKNLRNELKRRLKNSNASHESIERVVNKFRGNAGEIMIEALVVNGVINLGMPGTYEPVDPAHEQFVDATMEKDGLPIGIQIKNYKYDNNIHREVLTKAAAMSDIWLRRDKKIPDDMILDFVKSPCQYVISTCKPSNDMLVDDYKNCVVFLGPDWLDDLKIQGNSKTGESSRWKIFRNVADEINGLTDPRI